MGEGPKNKKQKRHEDKGLIHAKCDSARNKNNQCRLKSLITDTFLVTLTAWECSRW